MRSEHCTCARNFSQTQNRTANLFPSHLRSAVSSSIDFVPPGSNFHDSPRFDAFLFSSQIQSQSKPIQTNPNPIQTELHFQFKSIQTNPNQFQNQIRAKAEALASYDLDWWLEELLPSCAREKAIQTTGSGRGSAGRTVGLPTALPTTGGCLTYSVLIPGQPSSGQPSYCVVPIFSMSHPFPEGSHYCKREHSVSFGPT
jgi:hypothetical protein